VSANLLQQFRDTSSLSGGNAAFIEDLYENWLRDPTSVGAEWQKYFDGLQGRGDKSHTDAIARIEAA